MTVALAWLMPVAFDGFVVSALVLWLSPVPARVASFAKRNTYAAALAGIVAQSAYHALSTSGTWWRPILAAAMGAAPPALSAGAVHMRALLRRESGLAATTTRQQRTPATRPTVNRPPATVRPATPATIRPDTRPATPASPVNPATGQAASRPSDTGNANPGQAATANADSGTDTGNADSPDSPDAKVIILPPPGTRRTARGGQSAGVSVDDLANALAAKFGDEMIGKPAAQAYLRTAFGTCSNDRAIKAKNRHNARIRQTTTSPKADNPAEEDQPDPDREPVAAGI